jgi:hypothetical protein
MEEGSGILGQANVRDFVSKKYPEVLKDMLDLTHWQFLAKYSTYTMDGKLVYFSKV